MGVLAQAKNGDKQFLERKFHAANGKAESACTQSALILYFLSFVSGGGDFFSFFFCSQYVPFKFPISFHHIPNTFPRLPMSSPKVLLANQIGSLPKTKVGLVRHPQLINTKQTNSF